MRTRYFLLAAPLLVVAGCKDVLDVKPKTEIPAAQAVTDAASAGAALSGAYNALANGNYYGQAFVTWGDLLSDNGRQTGTFTSYIDAAQHQIRSDNGQVSATWTALYDAINRSNVLLATLPTLSGVDAATKNQMLGEAYFLRALNYHNLVKYWGIPGGAGVPLRLAPLNSPTEAAGVTRAPTSDIYKQIHADLKLAKPLLLKKQTRQASYGAAMAIEARVYLYEGNWAAAKAAADTVVAQGYQLAANYPDLFTATGANTVEDIFRIAFDAVNSNSVGFYYLAKSVGGRQEVSPSTNLINTYTTGDLRKAWNISATQGPKGYWGTKIPTAAGAENLHVIRFGEVVLIRAEAEARLNQLTEAVADVNLVHRRAGLPALVLGMDVVTQQDVIDAAIKERRLDLALEGDRWPDLVRLYFLNQSPTPAAILSMLNLTAAKAYQLVWPIPQREIDVSQGSQPLVQNPGY